LIVGSRFLQLRSLAAMVTGRPICVTFGQGGGIDRQ